MLAQSFQLFFLILLISLAFLLEPFLILPLHHTVMLLLPPHLFGCLRLPHLLKHIALLLSDQLLLQLRLMLLPPHPFFMGDCCSTALANLTALLLLDRAVVESRVLAT
jgi:hypothetical protein